MTRITVYYTGRVQGVGFRYTTSRIAERFAVAGYVMNLPDGRVELVVEASRKEADAFLAGVLESLGGYIAHVEQEIGPSTGEFGDANARGSFTIRH
tara:strand:- start:1886 stop:2173 length:288 start_codon:yes stop_codon:yes gene_type:complete